MLRLSCALLVTITSLTISCGDSDAEALEEYDARFDTGSTAEQPACTATVSASENAHAAVQQALIDATSDAVICFEAGHYAIAQELSLRVAGVTLRGPADHSAVLDFSGQTTGAQGISVDADDFVMEDLHVKNTRGDGVRVDASNGVTFRNVRVSWDAPDTGAGDFSGAQNGAYALYPVGSENVLIENCEVVGASDAGIYVGQSRNIIVRNNYVHGNVAGIEIENCIGALVEGNLATDNSAGILVFDLPNLTLVNGMTTRVRNNTVTDNNHVNFAPEGIVGSVPPGTGVMLLSAKDVEVDHNSISLNTTTGVFVVSLTSLNIFAPGSASWGEEFDPWTHDIYVHDNTFSVNGVFYKADGNPAVDDRDDVMLELAPLILAVNGSAAIEDVLWDGFGLDGTLENPAADSSDAAQRVCIRGNGNGHARNLRIPDLAEYIAAGDFTTLPEMPVDEPAIICDLNMHADISLPQDA